MSPIVAAVAALVGSVNPSLSNDEITSVLEQTAVDAELSSIDPLFGHGRVDAGAALLIAAAMPGSEVTTNSIPTDGSRPPPSSEAPTPTNATIAVQIEGLGRVSPNPNGKTLRAGQLINLRALPAS